MKMVFIKFKPDGKEYGFGVPEDYKGSAGLKPGSWVRVPVPGCRKKMLRVVVRVDETATPPEGLKMIGYSGRQIAQTANKKARRAAHQGGIIYLAKKAKAEKRAMLGGRPIDLAWEAEKAAWIEDDLDIEPYLAKGYNTDEGLPKLTELRLGMRMGFDESSYDDPTLPLHIIKKRRVHQLRDWAKEQGLLPPMYYEDPVHGIDKEQLRELLIGIANGIMPDTYGLKLIKLHKCGPRVLREMRLCREAGMTSKEIRPYWALGVKKLQDVRAAFLAENVNKYIDITCTICYNDYRIKERRLHCMANININIRMDSDLKQQFEAFCNDVGMTMTTAFTVFAKKAVREYRIPFEIGAEVPNAETKKAIEDARKGIGMSKAFSSVEELMEDLNADD